MIGGLIGFENVRVFGVDPRSRYDTETVPRAAAPGVHIGYVLKGRINRAGNQIQITVALLQAADNQYLWSGRFCREFSPNNMIMDCVIAFYEKPCCPPFGKLCGVGHSKGSDPIYG